MHLTLQTMDELFGKFIEIKILQSVSSILSALYCMMLTLGIQTTKPQRLKFPPIFH